MAEEKELGSGAEQSGGDKGEQSGNQNSSLFNIPQEMMATLPPEVINIMEQTGKHWQGEYTKKRQSETEELKRLKGERDAVIAKAKQYDDLLGDPEFQRMITMYASGQSGERQQSGNGGNTDAFAKYGDNAESMRVFMDDIKGIVSDAVDAKVSPILSKFDIDKSKQDWNDLIGYTKDKNLPDPTPYQYQINALRKASPRLTSQQAYHAVLGLDGLQMRESIAGDEHKEEKEADKLPPIFPPNAGKQGSSSSEREETDPIQVALNRRKDGVVPNITKDMSAAIKKALAEVNKEKGTTFKLSDF